MVHSSGQPTHDIYGVVGDFYSDIVLKSYGTCVLGSMLAQSELIKTEDWLRSRAYHVLVQNHTPLNAFVTDDNEYPEFSRPPLFEDKAFTVCQSLRLIDKISDYELYKMGDKYDLVEKAIESNFRYGIAERLDHYTIATLLLSASPYNMGNHAGKDTGSYDLGTQDANALNIDTGEDLIKLIERLRAVASETGMFCGTAEQRLDGVEAQPIILLPQTLAVQAMEMVRIMANVCKDCSIIRNFNGFIGNIFGINILTTKYLTPVDFGSGVGRIAPVLLLDPNQVASAFDIVSNKVIEREFEKVMATHVIYDTAVINPDAVVVAQVRV